VNERGGFWGPWGLRVLALALALLLWFFVAVEEREGVAEKVVEAAITYSPPNGYVLLDPVQRARVRLRGRASRIRNLNPFVVDIFLEIPAAERSAYDLQILPENVIMPEGVEVVTIEPATIRVRLDREVTGMLPVRARLVGEPAAGAVAREVQVIPDKVLVSGPESRLRAVNNLVTTAVDLDGHALDFEETAAVLSPDPLIKVLQPAVVTVRVPMQPPAEQAR
jgi:YbbR domain-containing protein